EPRRGITFHLDFAPENAARLALEIAAIAGPVDEIRADQRDRQRQDHQSAKDDKKSRQCFAPAVEARLQYPDQRVDKVASCRGARQSAGSPLIRPFGPPSPRGEKK